jgi:precorrin isomerase
MQNKHRLNQLDPAEASGKTKQLFDIAQTKFGAVPNLIRVLGNAPAALATIRSAPRRKRHYLDDEARSRSQKTFRYTTL